jgi:hypothetical protein
MNTMASWLDSIVVLLLELGFMVGLAAGNRPALGTNLNGVSYWSTQLPFVDAFKSSGAWLSCSAGVWDDKRHLDLDERGWVRTLLPDQRVSCALFTDPGRFPGLIAGRYQVEYAGTGTLS